MEGDAHGERGEEELAIEQQGTTLLIFEQNRLCILIYGWWRYPEGMARIWAGMRGGEASERRTEDYPHSIFLPEVGCGIRKAWPE